MSDIRSIFDISGRAMSAQMIRLNTIASNLANVASVSGSPDTAYRALRPVFETKYADAFSSNGMATADVADIIELERSATRTFMPDHVAADEEGYVYSSAVNPEEEMVDMLEAARQYQNNLEVINTMRALMMRTINMGK